MTLVFWAFKIDGPLGHRDSTPLFITNRVEVLRHFNLVCHPNKMDKSYTFFIQLSKSGTHMLYIQFIPAQNFAHSSSSPSPHCYATCSFTFMGIQLWMVLTLFKLLRISMLKFFETCACVTLHCHAISMATCVIFALLRQRAVLPSRLCHLND